MNFSAAKEVKLKELKEQEKKFIQELSLKIIATIISSEFLEENVSVEQFERVLEKAIKKLPESDLRVTLLENITSHSNNLYRSLKEKKPIASSVSSNVLLKRKRNEITNLSQSKKPKKNNEELSEDVDDNYKVFLSPEVTNDDITIYYDNKISKFILNDNSKDKNSSYQDQFLEAIKEIWFLSQSDRKNSSKLRSLSLSFLSLFETLFDQFSFELSSHLFSERVLEVLVKYMAENKEHIENDEELYKRFYIALLQFYLISNFSDAKIAQISSQIFTLIYSTIFPSIHSSDNIIDNEDMIKNILSDIKYDEISYHKGRKLDVLSKLYVKTICSPSSSSSISDCVLSLIVFKKALKCMKGKAKEITEIKGKIGRKVRPEFLLSLAKSLNVVNACKSIDGIITHIVKGDEAEVIDQLQSVSLAIPSSDETSEDTNAAPLFFIDKKSNRRSDAPSILSLDVNHDDTDDSDEDANGNDDEDEDMIRFADDNGDESE